MMDSKLLDLVQLDTIIALLVQLLRGRFNLIPDLWVGGRGLDLQSNNKVLSFYILFFEMSSWISVIFGFAIIRYIFNINGYLSSLHSHGTLY